MNVYSETELVYRGGMCFQGHDTTSAGMNWLLHLIGSDQRVQEKVQAELDDIFGDDHRAPTFVDVGKMK